MSVVQCKKYCISNTEPIHYIFTVCFVLHFTFHHYYDNFQTQHFIFTTLDLQYCYIYSHLYRLYFIIGPVESFAGSDLLSYSNSYHYSTLLQHAAYKTLVKQTVAKPILRFSFYTFHNS